MWADEAPWGGCVPLPCGQRSAADTCSGAGSRDGSSLLEEEGADLFATAVLSETTRDLQ